MEKLMHQQTFLDERLIYFENKLIKAFLKSLPLLIRTLMSILQSSALFLIILLMMILDDDYDGIMNFQVSLVWKDV